MMKKLFFDIFFDGIIIQHSSNVNSVKKERMNKNGK